MEEYKIIGEIDINKLGIYRNLITTNQVILTDERKQHIKDKHPGHYESLKKYLKNVIYNPDYILQDIEHEETVILLKDFIEDDKKIKMIIRLNTNKAENKYNSIITFWNIRKRDYEKAIAKSKIIFKKLDKDE